MVCIGIGLRNVLTLDIHALEFAGAGRVEHVRNPEARLGIDRHAPVLLELCTDIPVRDGAIARQLVRE